MMHGNTHGISNITAKAKDTTVVMLWKIGMSDNFMTAAVQSQFRDYHGYTVSEATWCILRKTC